MKKKATELLDIISGYPELISFNDKNMEVSINGEPMKHTNFIDLFRSLYSTRRNYTPAGYTDFLSALSDMNAPTSLISNKLAWSNIIANQNESINKALPAEANKQKAIASKLFGNPSYNIKQGMRSLLYLLSLSSFSRFFYS